MNENTNPWSMNEQPEEVAAVNAAAQQEPNVEKISLEALCQKKNDLLTILQNWNRRKAGLEQRLKTEQKKLERIPEAIPMRVLSIIILAPFVLLIMIFAIASFFSSLGSLMDYYVGAEGFLARMVAPVPSHTLAGGVGAAGGLFGLPYFILVGVLAKVSKKSFAWTFLNLPTCGIFGIAFSIKQLIRSFSVGKEKEKQIQLIKDLENQHWEACQQITECQQTLAELDRDIALYQQGD